MQVLVLQESSQDQTIILEVKKAALLNDDQLEKIERERLEEAMIEKAKVPEPKILAPKSQLHLKTLKVMECPFVERPEQLESDA